MENWGVCRDFLLGSRLLGPSDYFIDFTSLKNREGWLGRNSAHGYSQCLDASLLLPSSPSRHRGDIETKEQPSC